jgi:hypothetical protein
MGITPEIGGPAFTVSMDVADEMALRISILEAV